MSSGLQKRLMRGFAAQGFAQIVNLIIQLGSVSIYLHYWGNALYGEWVGLSSVLGYLSISDLSFGNAAQNEMTMSVARGNKAGALSVFQSCWLLVTAVSLIFLLVSLALVPLMPLERWLHIKQMSHADVVYIVDLLVLQVILAQQGGMLVAGFRCDGNFALGVMANNILRLAEFLLTVAAVVGRGGLAGVALAVLLTRIVGYVIMYWLLHRRSPWLSIGFRHARFAVIKPLIGPALSFNAIPLGQSLNLQGVVNVIGVGLGPVMVTLFSTLRTFSRLGWQFLNIIANTVWVELSAAFAANDLPLARSLHRRACQVALWGALGAAAILMIAGGPIYHVWTRGRVPFDAGLLRLLLLLVVCSSLWSTSYVVPISVNRNQALAAVYLAVTGCTVALAALLMRHWGIVGVTVALIVGEISMILYVVRSSLLLLEDNLAGFLRVVLTPPVGWLWAKLVPGRARHVSS